MMQWREKSINRQKEVEELLRANKILNDKVMRYRNLFEDEKYKNRNAVFSDIKRSLLADTIIDQLRETPTNSEWRYFIMTNFN